MFWPYSVAVFLLILLKVAELVIFGLDLLLVVKMEVRRTTQQVLLIVSLEAIILRVVVALEILSVHVTHRGALSNHASFGTRSRPSTF